MKSQKSMWQLYIEEQFYLTLSLVCLVLVSLKNPLQLALWSYAVYLMHQPVFMLIGEQLGKRHIDANPPLTIVLVTAEGVWVDAALLDRDSVHANTGALVSGWKPASSRTLKYDLRR